MEQLPRGNKNKEKSLFNPPHPNLLPQGEGVRTLKSTALGLAVAQHLQVICRDIVETKKALIRDLFDFDMAEHWRDDEVAILIMGTQIK